MFIGHHAVSLAVKPLAPRVSLGTLFAATILLDLIWPILILLGIEDVRVLRATRARDRAGSVALWSLVVFLGAIYVVNLTAPPPPDAKSIALAGLAQWLFVPWGAWIDRHRAMSDE